MDQITQQTQKAITAIQAATAVNSQIAAGVAAVTGTELQPVQSATTIPAAMEAFVVSLANITAAFEGYTETMTNLTPPQIATSEPVPLLEKEPEVETSESLTAGAGGINHANRIGLRDLEPATNGVHTTEEPAQKGKKRGGGKGG